MGYAIALVSRRLQLVTVGYRNEHELLRESTLRQPQVMTSCSYDSNPPIGLP
jgi:hypothetical protein